MIDCSLRNCIQTKNENAKPSIGPIFENLLEHTSRSKYTANTSSAQSRVNCSVQPNVLSSTMPAAYLASVN